LKGAQFEAGVLVVIVGGGGGGALSEGEPDGSPLGGGLGQGGAEDIDGEGLAWGERLGEGPEGAGFGKVVSVGK